MDSQVQSSESVEWVYIVETDEPTIYETETPSQAQRQTNEAIDAFFTSKAPAEETAPSKSTAEQEYFGDVDDKDGIDIIDDRIPPEKAFETFLGRNFPANESFDYSGSIYHPPPVQKTPVLPSQKSGRAVRLPGSESKAQRLARLVAEVEQLSTESGLSADAPAVDAFNQMKELRAQLRTIEQQASYIPPLYTSTASPLQDTGEKAAPAPSGDAPLTVQVLSPNFDTLASLEQRVSALENSVDVSRLEDSYDGMSLASLVDDVRARLSLITDTTLSDRLKDDAKQIAQIMRSELQTERGQDTLRVATLLDKMQEWQPLVDSLPILVDRFASVRHLHEEAENFVTAMSAMTKQLDSMESRHNTNKSLLTSVQNSLEVNMKSVNHNIEILKRRLDAAKGNKPDAA